MLVDTYDTLNSGIPHAIQVFKEMRAEGIPLTFYGIRMDSGDLAYLSKEAKKMLDAEGFTDAVISASNDLDETLITSLKNQGATINSWGVGTNLITSKDCPSFGGVYKLAAIMDKMCIRDRYVRSAITRRAILRFTQRTIKSTDQLKIKVEKKVAFIPESG